MKFSKVITFIVLSFILGCSSFILNAVLYKPIAEQFSEQSKIVFPSSFYFIIAAVLVVYVMLTLWWLFNRKDKRIFINCITIVVGLVILGGSCLVSILYIFAQVSNLVFGWDLVLLLVDYPNFQLVNLLPVVNIPLAIFMVIYVTMVIYNYTKRLVLNRYANIIAANIAILAVVTIVVIQNKLYEFLATIIRIGPRVDFEIPFSIIAIGLCATAQHFYHKKTKKGEEKL